MNDLPRDKNDIGEIISGDHICFIFNSRPQLLYIRTHFLNGGLFNKQKCVYVVDKSLPSEVVDELKISNNEVDRFSNSGQLTITTKDKTYLENGKFDPLAMIKLIKKSEQESMDEGYEGLRGMGEMSWALSYNSKLDKLIDYESEINFFIQDSYATFICAYDENKFPKEVLLKAIAAHPYLILYDKLYKNDFYQPNNLNERDFSNVSYEEVVRGVTKN